MFSGSKIKYKKMESEPSDYHQQQLGKRKKSARKFVVLCAAFASINNVLIGYGKFFPFFFPFWFFVFCYFG